MDSLVVTLDTAKKLKAAGFPQDTAFTWGRHVLGHTAIVRGAKDDGWLDQWAAPTSQEIANQLDGGATISKNPRRDEYGAWMAGHPSDPFSEAATMSEAMALLWLKLQEAK
jgi:hypothetical protein